jgi:hypothetical protein
MQLGFDLGPGKTTFRVTAASAMNFRTSLDNWMYLYDSGEFELQMTMSPTQNFVPGRRFVCRFTAPGDHGRLRPT